MTSLPGIGLNAGRCGGIARAGARIVVALCAALLVTALPLGETTVAQTETGGCPAPDVAQTGAVDASTPPTSATLPATTTSPAQGTLPATTTSPATTASPATGALPTPGILTNPAPSATPVGLPPIPARVDGPSGVVALTFDAGADRGYAEDILDTLLEEQVPASFGMTGLWAQAHPELVQRMVADGHMLINHTFDHRSFTGVSDHLGGLSAERRQSELLDADAIIQSLVGHTTCPWYRLPYGDDGPRVDQDTAEIGYTQKVGWNVDTLGWRGVPMQDIVARSLRLAAPNAIYVMHVGVESRDGPALPAVIDGLRELGYGFATVAQLSQE
jgi:peptidoglycan-N-acetylglucosamine deacetylase